MSSQPTHDLAIKTGEYQDAHGQTKGRWLRVGTLFQHDDGGTSIKLDALPLGLPGWQGWVSVFPRDAQQAQGAARPAAPAHDSRQGAAMSPPGGFQDFDDEIPFN